MNGFAFFAENGRGKTSLYNAMRWALWGEVLPRVRALMGSKVRAAPIPIVGEFGDDVLLNADALRDDNVAEMSVVLLAENEKGEQMQVLRTASSTTTRPRDDSDMSISLVVNDGQEAHSDAKAQMAVERFFPRELERFFFIDGEALEEYTDMLEQDSEQGLKSDVEAVLRLPALSRGKDDLVELEKKVSTQLSRTRKASGQAQKAERDYHAAERNLREVQQKISALNERISAGSARLREIELQQQANADLRVIHEERSKVKGVIGYYEDQLNKAAEKRIRHAKGAWKSLIWKRAGPMRDALRSDMDKITNAGYKKKQLEDQIERWEATLNASDLICPTCEQEVKSKTVLVKRLKADIEEARTELEEIGNLALMSSDEAAVRLGRLTNLTPQAGNHTMLAEADQEWAEAKKNFLDAKEKLDDLNKRISDEDSDTIGELNKEFGRLQSSQKSDRDELKELKRRENELSNDVVRLRKKSGGVDASEDQDVLDTVQRLIKTIEKTLATYREKARARTSELASEAFMAMTNAPETYSGVELDKEFRGRILRTDGRAVVRPSSGMKSIMTVSIIDALRKVSGLHAPVFFDTPGRSLDEHHKEEFLKHFWKADHGMQFLIFAHSGEFRIGETVEEFGDRIAKAWQLTYPGDHRTCITCGGEVSHDRRTKKNTCLDSKCGYQWDITLQHTVVKEVPINV